MEDNKLIILSDIKEMIEGLEAENISDKDIVSAIKILCDLFSDENYSAWVKYKDIEPMRKALKT